MTKTDQFDKLKADFHSAKKKTNQAKNDIKDAEKALKRHKEKLPELNEAMMEAKANEQAGEGSSELAEKAQNELEKAMEELEKLKVDLEVKKRVLPKRMKQERKSCEDLQAVGGIYYSEKAQPILDRLETAVIEVREATKESEGLFKEATQFKIPAHHYIPLPLSDVFFKIDGSIQKENIEAYLTKIRKLKAQTNEN